MARSRSRPRRADARQNIEAILQAAERCLARDPDASMGDIAAEAGLGRITVYAHFATRAALVAAATKRVLADANELLAGVDVRGAPADVLARLVEASWAVTMRSGSLVVAAEKALSPQVVREAHAGELEDRVKRVLARGQREGAFRKDLPTAWLVTVFHATIHAAASEVHAGRLDAAAAAGLITATLHGAYRRS